MAFIVTESCINCKFGDCIEVCPVDCFYEGDNMVVIDPEECIDCGLCEQECPVNAIYSEDDVPKDQEIFVDLNRDLSSTWQNINEKCIPLKESDKWSKIKNKLHLLKK